MISILTFSITFVLMSIEFYMSTLYQFDTKFHDSILILITIIVLTYRDDNNGGWHVEGRLTNGQHFVQLSNLAYILYSGLLKIQSLY